MILSTVREIDLPKLRFTPVPGNVELIIIDSHWSIERKKKLAQTEHGFKKITYAPPKKRENNMPTDFISGLNTGLAYAEESWCFCLGGNENEDFKPNFFEIAKEDIGIFGDNMALRPMELESWSGDTKWTSYVKQPKRHWFLPCEPLGKTGLRAVLPIITCGAAIMHISNWFAFNGFDERYDVGGGWYDNDLFGRILVKGCPFVFDQELMFYRNQHKSAFSKEGRDECEGIYRNSEKKIYAPNDFDLKELHEKMAQDKQGWML